MERFNRVTMVLNLLLGVAVFVLLGVAVFALLAPDAGASAPPARMHCDYGKGWEPERCENEEAVCYTTSRGLSCWRK